jgi:hypothetical protein
MNQLAVRDRSNYHDGSEHDLSDTLLRSVERFISTAPLAGLPTQVMVEGKPMACGPNLMAREAAIVYCLASGLSPRSFPRDYLRVDRKRAVIVANLYDHLESMPQDPETQASYEALVSETLAQWQIIKATGLRVEYNPTSDGHPDPYANPRLLISDVLENNHLFVTETRLAFGSTPQGFEDDVLDNPLLREVIGEQISGRVPLVNDILRLVHDYFGHVREGLGFRVHGEYNAWRGHLAMYSPLAARALTTEMLGQNCWVNFGPLGDLNRKADVSETRYAEQKVGLLPEWVAEWIVCGTKSEGLDA